MWDPREDLTRRNKAKGEALVKQAWERARYIELEMSCGRAAPASSISLLGRCSFERSE